jgi:hypothetical protein
VTRSRGRWLSWAGWGVIAVLIGIAAWLFPDPFGIGESQEKPQQQEAEPRKPPRFTGKVTTDKKIYPLLRFLEAQESDVVYLDLTVPCCEKGIDVGELFPGKSSESPHLSVRECPPKQTCTDIDFFIQSDPNVEQRVFDAGEPESYIRGYFIVSDYFTQQGMVRVTLKPVSVKDVQG